MNLGLYNRKEVCSMVDINANTLGTWIHEGYIIPTSTQKKQRVMSYFNTEVIYKISVFKRLTECGVANKLAAIMIKNHDMSKIETTQTGMKYTFIITATVPII